MQPGNPHLFKLSPNFTLWEAYKSQSADRNGIDNRPPEQVIPALIRAAALMEKIRETLGSRPISPSSWYRSPSLNRVVGGASRSQHIHGTAVDFDCDPYGTPLDICRAIIANKSSIRFEQLILEHSWVHVSVPNDPNGKPKLQVLSLLKSGSYANGLTNTSGVPYGSV